MMDRKFLRTTKKLDQLEYCTTKTVTEVIRPSIGLFFFSFSNFAFKVRVTPARIERV